MNDIQHLYQEIKDLRRALHFIPELSFQEKKTKKMLLSYLAALKDIAVYDRGCWFYAVYHGKEPDHAIAFRADFDAVEDSNGCASHLCGHDGHAAILAGFAKRVSELRPDRTIYFLFQPAEETGEGGVLCSRLLEEAPISEIYAIHNIPGYETGSILLLPDTFACASTGLEITLTGSPSHAAYPEAGANPANAIAELILYREELLKDHYEGLTLVTVIGCDLGSRAYGVSASKGILRLTIRAEKQRDFQRLTDAYIQRAEALSQAYHLSCSIRKIEEFPSTENHLDAVKRVEAAALFNNFSIVYPSEPFRWSEDFGFYLQKTAGADFGVGAGAHHPQLHTKEYEFPDEIIPFVIQMYESLITIQPGGENT